MATTVRLPEVLQNEATTYAQTLGLSLNNIIAVALRDYLDRHKTATQLAPEWKRQSDGRCSCGSGKRYDKCHGSA